MLDPVRVNAGDKPRPKSFAIQFHFNSFYLEPRVLKFFKINTGFKK